MTAHELIIGESTITAEYCAKYGFLVSPGCCNKYYKVYLIVIA
jgi:hypothetical protein